MQFFIADAALLAVASANEVLRTLARRRRVVRSYVGYTSGWHEFLFFVSLANACAIDPGGDKHEGSEQKP